MSNEKRGTVLRIPTSLYVQDQADGVSHRTVIVRVYDHPPPPVEGVTHDTEEIQITSSGIEFALWVRVIR
mgnify:CR=1 FL=1|tara:strand:+ start:2298 stop:2507 length:210 start_codon:yes stop_codon:yes gene_type:complete